MSITDERALPYVYYHQVVPADTVEELNAWAGAKLPDGAPQQFAKEEESGSILGWDGISYQIPVTVGDYLVISAGGYSAQYLSGQNFERQYTTTTGRLVRTKI